MTDDSGELLRRLAAVLLLFGLSGCSPSSDAQASKPGPSDASVGDSAADAADADGATAPLSGHVIFDKYNNQLNIAAKNRAIGVAGGPSTTTDENGAFALTVPTLEELVLRADLSGQVSVERVVNVPKAGLEVELRVFDIDTYVGAQSQLGAQVDSFSTGIVALRFVDSTSGGFGATLNAASAGTFVLDGGVATATDQTLAAGDSLYFYQVAPGPVTVTIAAPKGVTCHDAFAQPNVYPVEAVTLTEIVLSCQ